MTYGTPITDCWGQNGTSEARGSEAHAIRRKGEGKGGKCLDGNGGGRGEGWRGVHGEKKTWQNTVGGKGTTEREKDGMETESAVVT